MTSDLTLKQRLLAKLAFDVEDSNMSYRDAMYAIGITIERANTKLAPIHEALADCVDAIDAYFKEQAYERDHSIKSEDLLIASLAKLERAIGSEE